MALGDLYLELAEIKDYLHIKSAKLDNDETLTDAITSASREIERICNRQFNKVDTASPRLYAATTQRGNRLLVDDFYTLDDLVVEHDPTGLGDWVAIPDTHYEVSPFNGVVDGLPGWPYWVIHIDFWPTFCTGRRARFRVTAKWGWESVPADVRQACMMLAADTFQMKDSPYGVMSDQYGVTLRPSGPVSGLGTQARLKLSRYTRTRLLVA
ncbi:head-tail connector protein [Streptomyces sp. NPDC002754]